MIYILVGSDTKNKNLYIKELTRGRESFFVEPNILSKDLVMSYSSNVSLFGENPTLILDDVFSSNILDFNNEEFKTLKDSNIIFILREDKMLAATQNKLKKYGEIKLFEEKKKNTTDKFNIFSITDAYAIKDKMNTWVLYHKAIENGVESEAIAGVLFWKIKSMIINGSRVFSANELKKQSSAIIALYHKAHRGELDFSIGLEQFILNFLSNK